MLVLFLLNAVGYYGIFVGLQFKYAREANEKFDDDQYSNAETITFKIALTVPYSVDHQNFERVTGEFEHQGEVYRLVKQKLYRDTLSIVCIKDVHSQAINQALTDYVRTFSDHPVNSKQQSKLIQWFIKDYLLTGTVIESQSLGWKKNVTYPDYNQHYFFSLSDKIKYPPKSLSVS